VSIRAQIKRETRQALVALQNQEADELEQYARESAEMDELASIEFERSYLRKEDYDEYRDDGDDDDYYNDCCHLFTGIVFAGNIVD
jgi:hypothetical protein